MSQPTTRTFRRRECHICLASFRTVAELQSHFHNAHPYVLDNPEQMGGGYRPPLQIFQSAEAFNELYQEFNVPLEQGEITIEDLFTRVNSNLVKLMEEKLLALKNYKIQFSANLHFTKTQQDGST